MKTFYTLLAAIALLMPLMTNAQDKSLIETPALISYDVLPNGPQGGIQTGNVDRERINQITKELTLARMNGNAILAEQLNNELEIATGNHSYKSNGQNSGPQPTCIVVNEPVEQTDYNMTIINGTDGFWATANSTDRISGRMWVIGTAYNISGSDTLKIYTSSNNGITWILLARIQYGVAGVHYRNDELDIEAVNNGTNQYIFSVAGFNYSGTSYCSYLRINSSAGEFASGNLGTSSATVKNFYPRITSDNARFTNLAYVYAIWTQDSTRASDRHLKTKVALMMSPFAASPITITYRLGGGSDGAYWWNNGVATSNDTTFMYNDIAIADSLGGSKLVTVTNFYRSGFNNLYMTSSSDFGATAPGWVFEITETRLNLRPRLAATGLDSTYMMIGTTRQWNATDWDPYYYRTSNDGVNWSGGYVSSLTDTTFYTDVVAIPRVSNTFRFVYAVRTGSDATSNIFSRSFNNGVFLNSFQLNPVGLFMSGIYTPVRAGYRYSTDSCFSSAEGVTGVGAYAFSGCDGTITGIGNNETPLTYALSQNFPNPFNPVTRISFALPKQGFVTLKVYDVLGKEVATLVNEMKNQGSYSVDFNASNFSSGVYFYKIETNGFSDIKKMMMIK
ncbi:MAG: T9SS type A sorting domain-containing protein [Candidatus Kapaibacterium sp.]